MSDRSLKTVSAFCMIAILVLMLLAWMDDYSPAWKPYVMGVVVGALGVIMNVCFVLATVEESREWNFVKWIPNIAFPLLIGVGVFLIFI